MADNEQRSDRSRQASVENKEWLDSLEYVYQSEGPERVVELLRLLQARAQEHGVVFMCPATTSYINTIPKEKQPPYPGSREIERRIKSIVRWNAMAMVVRANREASGIGGHISTYASLATLLEVAFNHFLRAPSASHPGDIVYFQGHASPGVYARAFLEGRLSRKDLENFRRELRPDGGLASYPHPWLMPNFWCFPSVSMGLAPIMAIYQARFLHYLVDREIVQAKDQKVWAFLGDGEMDEPESMGALTLASREALDNLVFVINCNLQRLDGPVRGNGQIIQELEAAFRGARWNVIKVIWGDDWDLLLEKDGDGALVQALNGMLDGQAQKYTVAGGAYIREHFFGQDPRLLALVENYSDEQLAKMRRGGHDPEKVYAAYRAAVAHSGQPTVILAQTIKGYGLGEAGEGRNITHQQKKLNEDELRHFRGRFGIPVSDEQLAEAPFYKPPPDSEEIRYLKQRREALGGYLPARRIEVEPLAVPSDDLFREFFQGTDDREIATTMAFVHMLAKLMKDEGIGRRIVPIVPDEARTFGMEALFRQAGIYSHVGQLYEPVDRENLLYYREARDGAILEEGITEAGCLSSFIAAGTTYATYGLHMIPFFLFYSMFGFQRTGDLIWAAGDSRARGFLIGATAGRTTLPGEGLQHQDGQSHVLAFPLPNLKAYDPAFAYEIAVIVRDGLSRMFENNEDWIYYLTVMNEPYRQPPMPEGAREGILKGLYRIKASADRKDRARRAQLLGSGALLNEAIGAAKILEEEYDVPSDVWSVTSYKELHRDAVETERWNRLHPTREPRTTYVGGCLGSESGVFVAVSDYVKLLPASIARWIPGRYVFLGTDGFGRSDTRQALRDFFEVDSRHIVVAALHGLAQDGSVPKDLVKEAVRNLEIDPEKSNPVEA
jgi:pyruvate dehydrogenase E1 component